MYHNSLYALVGGMCWASSLKCLSTRRAPGFLKLFLSAKSVCVCPPPRALITTHVKWTRNNWLSKFWCFSVSLYGTSHWFYGWTWPYSNKARRERLPKECCISILRAIAVLKAKVGTRRSISVYRGEWAYRTRSETFKDKARLQLHSKNFGLKQVLFVRYWSIKPVLS